MIKNKRKILGYILVLLGIGIPLFAFSGMTWNQVSGQGNLRAFKEEVQGATGEEMAQREAQAALYNQNISQQNEFSAIDPFAVPDFKTDYKMEGLDQAGVFAYILIPKLEVVKPIYLGATEDHLAMGTGHLDGTHLPTGGVGTRSVIAGHRGWYSDTIFLYIDQLDPGDLIYIDRGTEVLAYSVTDKEIIGDSDWDKLRVRPGQDTLTLLTCHPLRPPRPWRLLVNATRVSLPNQEVLVGEGNLPTSLAPSQGQVAPEEDQPQSVGQTQTSQGQAQGLTYQKDPTTKKVNYAIFAICLIGWLSLIIIGVKFVRYLRK